MKLPTWLFGNDLLGFAADADLKLTAVDVPAGVWDVQPLEQFQARPPGLVQLVTLIEGRLDDAHLASVLSTLPPSASNSVSAERVRVEVDRIAASRPDDIAALASVISLETLTATDAALGPTVSEAVSALRAAADGTALFAHATAHLVRASAVIARRYALSRVLVRAHDDPSLFHRKPNASEVGRAFASAQGLFSDTLLGLDAYLDPLFLAMSPWVWAIDAPRSGGVVVYNLGQACPGRRGEAAELLQLFLPRGGTESGAAPTAVGIAETTAALRWWVERLDALFARLTDPANFCDASGLYQPRRHFEVLLGVEQVFRHTGSLLAHDRDRNARRVLLFSALDTLEGLGSVAFDQAVIATKAQVVLRAVSMSAGSAGGVLLRNAQLAVEGLRAVQDGFFLPSRVSAAGVRVPNKDGTDRVLTKEQAAAQWLRIVRNATHGFRGQQDKDKPRDEALLMSHTGDLPERLPLLAYLHLLHLLADPSQMERVLHRASR